MYIARFINVHYYVFIEIFHHQLLNRYQNIVRSIGVKYQRRLPHLMDVVCYLTVPHKKEFVCIYMYMHNSMCVHVVTAIPLKGNC